MKIFERPEFEVIKFTIEDIITSSGNPDDLPIEEFSSDDLKITKIG